MNRRSIFKAIFASAAAGTLLASPVSAAPVRVAAPEIMASVTYLDQARALVPLCAEWQRLYRANDPRQIALNRSINEQVDRLLGQMMDQFTGSAEPELVRQVFRGQIRPESLTADGMAGIAEAVVPVAVIRELVNKHRLPLRPDRLANWDRFMDRFASAMVA